MIVEAFISILVGIADGIFALLGNSAAPSWLTGVGGQLASLVDMSASLGSWVPWPVIAASVAAVGGAYLVSLTVKVVRMLISLFTGGGGSAA